MPHQAVQAYTPGGLDDGLTCVKHVAQFNSLRFWYAQPGRDSAANKLIFMKLASPQRHRPQRQLDIIIRRQFSSAAISYVVRSTIGLLTKR